MHTSPHSSLRHAIRPGSPRAPQTRHRSTGRLAAWLAISVGLAACLGCADTGGTGGPKGDDLRDAPSASDTGTAAPADTTVHDTKTVQDTSSTSDTPPQDVAPECTGSETRCRAGLYQACADGQFATVETCVAPEVCAEGIGCAGCDPARVMTCSEGDVHSCGADGTVGALVERCLIEPCSGGACGQQGCKPESQLIYVVDNDYQLLSFSPANDAHTFTLVSTLSCPAGQSWPAWGSGAGTPFSMSVDRNARAWVLYNSGEIFWVDTRTGQCEKSPFQPGNSGYELFGMGFVSDAPGAFSEQLYITGGSVGALLDGNIAKLDPVTMNIATIAPLPSAEYSPELTGTGNARFFAYFPGSWENFVAELDKTTGSIVEQWSLPALDGDVMAWAFAHWGGRFYIFVTVDEFWGPNSQVLRLDPATGQTDTILTDLPYTIVGAGVSTCAPFN